MDEKKVERKVKKMNKQTLEKIDNAIGAICDLSCERFKRINTDKTIALAEAIGKMLTARAELDKNQSSFAPDSF